jgi:hypothetical protein
LEKELVSESRILFEFKPQNSFFQQLMQESSHYVHSLKVIDKFIGGKPLPRKLLLLMDNCVEEIKMITCIPIFPNCKKNVCKNLTMVFCHNWATASYSLHLVQHPDSPFHAPQIPCLICEN